MYFAKTQIEENINNNLSLLEIAEFSAFTKELNYEIKFRK